MSQDYQINNFNHIPNNALRIGQKRDAIFDELREDIARVRLVCETIGFAMGVNEDLLSTTRGNPQNAFARQLAMYLSHVGLSISVSRVARAFSRDRTTVIYACHLIEDKRDDLAFDEFVDKMELYLREVPQFKVN